LKKFLEKILIFLITLFLVIFLRIYLSVFGFGNYIKLIKKPRHNTLYLNKLVHVSKSLKMICSILPNISCLVRASVLKIIFNGENSLKIIIGIKNNTDGKFESHAWVTFNDEIILNNDNKIESYKVIHKI